jgi:hypothetical protein
MAVQRAEVVSIEIADQAIVLMLDLRLELR